MKTIHRSLHVAGDLEAFCSAVRTSASGLDFSRRSLASDLLSLYGCGALVQLLDEEVLTRPNCRLHAANLLEYHFHWSETEAEIRAVSLFAAPGQNTGLIRRVLARGAAAFARWQMSPASIEDCRFDEIVASQVDAVMPPEFSCQLSGYGCAA